MRRPARCATCSRASTRTSRSTKWISPACTSASGRTRCRKRPPLSGSTARSGRRTFADEALERLDEDRLALQYPAPRFGDAEPFRSIDLRELHLAAAARRPLELEGIAADGT